MLLSPTGFKVVFAYTLLAKFFAITLTILD